MLTANVLDEAGDSLMGVVAPWHAAEWSQRPGLTALMAAVASFLGALAAMFGAAILQRWGAIRCLRLSVVLGLFGLTAAMLFWTSLPIVIALAALLLLLEAPMELSLSALTPRLARAGGWSLERYNAVALACGGGGAIAAAAVLPVIAGDLPFETMLVVIIAIAGLSFALLLPLLRFIRQTDDSAPRRAYAPMHYSRVLLAYRRDGWRLALLITIAMLYEAVLLPHALHERGESMVLQGYALAAVLVSVFVAAGLRAWRGSRRTKPISLRLLVCALLALSVLAFEPSASSLIALGVVIGGALGYALPVAEARLQRAFPEASRGYGLGLSLALMLLTVAIGCLLAAAFFAALG